MAEVSIKYVPLVTWEVVKRGRDVLGGIAVGGVADHQASFPHSSVPHQHTLHPPLRCSGSRWPGPPHPAGAPLPASDSPRRYRRSRGHGCRLVASVAPLRHLTRRGGRHEAGGDPARRFSPGQGQFSRRPFFCYLPGYADGCQLTFFVVRFLKFPWFNDSSLNSCSPLSSTNWDWVHFKLRGNLLINYCPFIRAQIQVDSQRPSSGAMDRAVPNSPSHDIILRVCVCACDSVSL